MMRWLALLCLLPGLVACGWQLRGQSGDYLALEQLPGVYIQSRGDAVLVQALQRQLADWSVARLASPQPGSLSLELGAPQVQSRVQTLGGDLRAHQVRLEMQLEFRLLNDRGEELLTDTLFAVRSYEQNPVEPASAERQRDQLTTELAEELAGQLVRLLPLYASVAREN